MVNMTANRKPSKIDYNKLSQFQLVEKIKEQNKEIKKLKKRKKYGLVWDEERTKEVFEQEVQKKLPVLKEVVKNEINDNDKSKPNNVLIEGDNYHALSVLNYTHKGKIDVVYIDPPYNSGAGGDVFVYNDKIIDENDSYKHSKWLSFMKKRLELAKKLLKKTGTIYITINDHEYSQLKLLCDEVFTEKNFIATIVWKTKTNANNMGFIPPIHDYILVYSKSSNPKIKEFSLPEAYIKKIYKNLDNDPKGLWKTSDLSANHKGPYFSIINPKTKKSFLPPKGRYWVFNEIEVKNRIKDGRIIFGSSGKNAPVQKKYLSDAKLTIKVDTLWDKVAYNSNGTLEITDILGPKKFLHPKPVGLIKHILKLSTDSEDTILDFFAGSGTAGHATLQLNKEDGGNRKFILCTNNENDICRNVCYPRLKKVIKGYKNPKSEKVEGLGCNLKYFKTSFVDSEPTDQNKKILVSQSTEMLCLKEDCFDLVTLGESFKIFKNHNNRYLGIVYNHKGIKPFKKAVLKLNKKVNAYVFSLIDVVDEDEFEEILSLVTLKPIPSAILNTYKRIFAYVETTKLSRKKHTSGLKQIGDDSGVSET